MRGMLTTAALSLILIIALGLVCTHQSRRASEIFGLLTEEVSAAIAQEDWEKALNLTRKMEQDWQKRESTLALFVNHEDVESVSMGLCQMRISLEEREKYHALLYAEELKEALSLMGDRDAFTLKNIL